jgi:hypothetical protein
MRVPTKIKQKTDYSQLSLKELDKLAEPFEKEFVPTRPLTPAMRKQDLGTRCKRGPSSAKEPPKPQ